MRDDRPTNLPLLLVALLGVALLAPLGLAPRPVGTHAGAKPSLPADRPAEAAEGGPLSPLLSYFGDVQGGAEKEVLARLRKRLARDCDTQFLIACIPDPVGSAQAHLFDVKLNTLQDALRVDRYMIDRFSLPWRADREGPAGGAEGERKEEGEREGKRKPPPRDYLQQPGVLLLRDPSCPTNQREKLLVVFLVGETPVAGVHKEAFVRSAFLLRHLADGWGERHRVPVLGPCFSGSAESLILALQACRGPDEPAIPAGGFRVVSGIATNVNAQRFKKRTGETFQSLQIHVDLVRQALIDFVVEKNPGDLTIAWLTEANTGYGGYAERAEAKRAGGTWSRLRIIEFPFPLLISRVRSAYAAGQPGGEGRSLMALGRDRLSIPLEELETGRDLPPRFTPRMTDVAVDRILSQILMTIHRENIRYVGITATDARDRIFLAGLVRQYSPHTQLLALHGDLLYAHPDYNDRLKGMLVGSTYPLHPANQRWTPASGDSRYVLFANSGYQGYYNAALALRKRPDLLEHAEPFKPASKRPPVWICVVGNDSLWPVRYRSIEEVVESWKRSHPTARDGEEGPEDRARALLEYTYSSPDDRGGDGGRRDAVAAVDRPSFSLLLALLAFGLANVLFYFGDFKWELARYFYLREPVPPAGRELFNKQRFYVFLCLVPLWLLLTTLAWLACVPALARSGLVLGTGADWWPALEVGAVVLGLAALCAAGWLLSLIWQRRASSAPAPAPAPPPAAASPPAPASAALPPPAPPADRHLGLRGSGVVVLVLLAIGLFVPGLWSILAALTGVACLGCVFLGPARFRWDALAAVLVLFGLAAVLWLGPLAWPAAIVLGGSVYVSGCLLGVLFHVVLRTQDARPLLALCVGAQFLFVAVLWAAFLGVRDDTVAAVGNAVLLHERTIRHLLSGVSLFVPGALLVVALYVAGFCQLKRLFMLAGFRPLPPWPERDTAPPAGASPGERSMRSLTRRLNETRTRIEQTLEYPNATLWRRARGWFFLALAVAAAWVARLWSSSVPPYEHNVFAYLLWAGLVVFLLFWVRWLLQVVFLVGLLRKLLRQLANLPMQPAFQRLPLQVASLLGRFLEARRPRLSHSRIPVQFVEQLDRDYDAARPGAVGPEWDGLPRDRLRSVSQLYADRLEEMGRNYLAGASTDAERFRGKANVYAEVQARLREVSGDLWGRAERHWAARPVHEAYPYTLDEKGREAAAPAATPAPAGAGAPAVAAPAPGAVAPGAGPQREPTARGWVGLAEEFLATQTVIDLSQFFAHAKNLLVGLMVASLLLLLGVLAYPLQPHRLLVFSCMMMVVVAALTAVTIFVKMERDVLVSRVSGTEPNRITLDRQFVMNIGLYVLPVAAILLVQALPDTWGWFSNLFSPVMRESR